MENGFVSSDTCNEQVSEVDNETDSSVHGEINVYSSLNRTADDQNDNVMMDENNAESDPFMSTHRNFILNNPAEVPVSNQQSPEVPVSNQHETTDHIINVNIALHGQTPITESTHLCSDFTAPPPEYEEYVVMEYYRTKGLVSSGAQTEPTSCLCSCHREPDRNMQDRLRNYGGETSGNAGHTPFSCTQQSYPYGSENCGALQRIDENPAGQMFEHDVTVHGEQVYDPISRIRSTPNNASTVQQDKIKKPLFSTVVLIMFIVVGCIIFGVIASTA